MTCDYHHPRVEYDEGPCPVCVLRALVDDYVENFARFNASMMSLCHDTARDLLRISHDADATRH
jgi:hypothetical protein